jgi:hypothetical protein
MKYKSYVSWACYQDEGDWNAYGILEGKKPIENSHLEYSERDGRLGLNTDIKEMGFEDRSLIELLLASFCISRFHCLVVD